MIKHALRNHQFIAMLYFYTRNAFLKFCYKVIDIKKVREKEFKKIFGYEPDFENPGTFSEFIQSRIIFDDNIAYSKLSDKYEVREWVAKKIGDKYLIPLLKTYNNPFEIDFEELPDSFVIKCNHDSRSTVVVQEKNKIDRQELVYQISKCFYTNYAYLSREPHYRRIKPIVLCEKTIGNGIEPPIDYKFHMFNGKVEFIQVDTDRSGEIKRNLYDSNWKQLDFTLNRVDKGSYLAKPNNLEQLIELSVILSQGFDYVRVDLYIDNSKIYFGEMTFTPGSGYSVIIPHQKNIELGKLING
ncbi:hypothetical protein NL53_17715 [Vibrio variabilis]|uniref:Glycosyltransferase n=1 Tax=Vibrio variabilis TaxID=990271 RepID=A0ABR4Y6U4_9VIBR|nr:ATP-grasp fold amidoligase family protein [Vibrio variabilis]KHA59179.1 hypothetical protein NL53_17715 [Vibrio variabilis]